MKKLSYFLLGMGITAVAAYFLDKKIQAEIDAAYELGCSEAISRTIHEKLMSGHSVVITPQQAGKRGKPEPDDEEEEFMA